MNPKYNHDIEMIVVGILTNRISNDCTLSAIVIFLWLCYFLDQKCLDGVFMREIRELFGDMRQLFEKFLNNL